MARASAGIEDLGRVLGARLGGPVVSAAELEGVVALLEAASPEAPVAPVADGDAPGPSARPPVTTTVPPRGRV